MNPALPVPHAAPVLQDNPACRAGPASADSRLPRAMRLPALLAALLLPAAVLAGGGETASPVVVELYTSQGCISCPPADALLRELAGRDDILPLALHVDYWDYIGWSDTFGSADFTERQKGYAKAAGERSIYTPQMVVDGTDRIVGYQPAEVSRLIAAHGATPDPVDVQLVRRGAVLSVRISARSRDPEVPVLADAGKGGASVAASGGMRPVSSAAPGVAGAAAPPPASARAAAPASAGTPAAAPDGVSAGTPAVVQLVRFLPEQRVAILRGENAGKDITYTNIVLDWSEVAEWDGAAPLGLELTLEGEAAVAVIVQAAGFGPVLGAAALD